MRILLLGGTSFIGRHIAQQLIADGHAITFFTRGVSNATLFPEQTHLRGDRTASLEALRDVEVDVVVDTSGFTPDAVRATAELLAARIARYIFISTIDVYDFDADAIDEESPIRSLPAGASRSERSPELYGAHKAQCERELRAILGEERLLVLRPGLVMGPHDYTDRFTYWPARVARGGRMLAPRAASMPVQVIDARDIAGWVARTIPESRSGIYNLTGTAGALSMGDVVTACIQAAATTPEIVWADDDFLVSQEVAPWVELPLWLPPNPEMRGLLRVRNDRALAAGLALRPLNESASGILDELRLRPNGTLKAGLAPGRERALLEQWDALREPNRASRADA